LILWQWNFGDGSPVATQQNPVHTYAADGTYLATLTVYNEGMCSKSYTRTVVVRPLPHVGFYNSNPCVYSSVQFTDTSFLAGYNILSWSWNFGDSTTATTATPQHNYNQFGIFNVTLTATASNACSNSMVQPITVNRLPLAQFAASNICEGNPVNVVNQSVLVNGNIATSVWNWGDGSTDSTFNPSHIYAVDGNYTIQLQVSGSNGCLKDTTALITIYDKPVAAFTHSNLCQQAPVQFTDGSTVQNDTLAAWAWNFNDGTLENQPSLVHTFSTYQTYNVQLIVTSGFGCSDTIIKPITIAPKPVANFSSEDVCFKEPMIFTDNSLVAVGNIQTWTWNFGDSFTSSLINPQHLYATTGNQNITLIVKTFNNCYDTISKQYKVYELPVADFIADTAEGCQPLWINYVNTSVPNEGMLVKWNWDFGDATTDTVAQPDAHLYDVPGYYDIFLQVETSLGCRDTLLNRNFIHVFPKPEAAFITEPSTTTILHAIIDIKDQSWGAVEWLYDFNDSTFSAERNPTHQFPMPAQYFVTQVVTSVDGCRDTTFRYVDVQNDFALYFPNSFTPNGDGKNESWKAEGIGIAEFNLQLFNRWGQTIFVSNSMEKGWDGSYQKQVVQQGVYIYKATVRDIFNKQHSYIGSVTVLR
jgi:gliding motility-associated-like protein